MNDTIYVSRVVRGKACRYRISWIRIRYEANVADDVDVGCEACCPCGWTRRSGLDGRCGRGPAAATALGRTQHYLETSRTPFRAACWALGLLSPPPPLQPPPLQQTKPPSSRCALSVTEWLGASQRPLFRPRFQISDRHIVNSLPAGFASFTLDFHPSSQGSVWGANASILEIDLASPGLLGVVTALAPAVLRLGGSEAGENVTYVGFPGFDAPCPSGYYYCLTRPRWAAILAFAARTGRGGCPALPTRHDVSVG